MNFSMFSKRILKGYRVPAGSGSGEKKELAARQCSLISTETSLLSVCMSVLLKAKLPQR